MSFEQICDWVVLIGAVTIAITNIVKFFKDPFTKGAKKSEQKLNEKIDARLEEKLPEYFDEHDKQTREKYLSQRLNYLNEIQTEVTNNISVPIEEISKNMVILTEAIATLQKGTKDVLRQKIMDIYHEFKDVRRFPLYSKEKVDELYKDYKAEGGNSYIDKYYGRMCKWDVDYSEEDSDEV